MLNIYFPLVIKLIYIICDSRWVFSVPYVLQAKGSELNWEAQNSQQLQRDKITLNNEANCLLSHKEWIWENKDVMQFYS